MKSIHKLTSVSAAIAALLVLAGGSMADTLPGPYNFEYLRHHLGTDTAVYGASDAVAEAVSTSQSASRSKTHVDWGGNVLGTTTVSINYSGSAETEVGNVPRVSASVGMSASASSLPGQLTPQYDAGFGVASAVVEYTLRVVADDGELYDNYVWVPLRVAVSGAASASCSGNNPVPIGYATAGGSVRIWASSHDAIRNYGSFVPGLEPGELQMGANASDKGPGASSFGYNGWLELKVGRKSRDLRVRIQAGAGAQVDATSTSQGSGAGSTASAGAWVDPVFEIDANWDQSDHYSLVYTPGVTQGVVPEIPEPATVCMLSMGGLACCLRSNRRRRTKAIA